MNKPKKPSQRRLDEVLANFVAEECQEALTEDELEVARDIRDRFREPGTRLFRDGRLSDKQRGLLFVYARKADPTFCDRTLEELATDPTELNAGVPRGAEVAPAEVLRVLPLKPPGRGGGTRRV